MTDTRFTRSGVTAALVLALMLGACRNDSDGRNQAGGEQQRSASEPRVTERTGTQAGKTPAPPLIKRSDVRDFRLGTGTPIELRNSAFITSRQHRVGSPVTATAARAVYSSRGDTVIPAGAEFVGRVTAIAVAERPGQPGTLRVDFDSVRLNGRTAPIEVRVLSLATAQKGRGVTAGDAAKVGAGAAVGGVAGRVIGGDRRGTIIGAATGAAAGAVIAHNTRDIDITLPVGAAINTELSRSFDASRLMARAPQR
jgi:hypothetical protein